VSTTSAIDAKAEYEIFQQIHKFEKNKNVIMISHGLTDLLSLTVRTNKVAIPDLFMKKNVRGGRVSGPN